MLQYRSVLYVQNPFFTFLKHYNVFTNVYFAKLHIPIKLYAKCYALSTL